MHDSLAESVPPPRPRFTSPVAPWWHTATVALLLITVSLLGARQAHRAGLEAHHAERYLTGIAAELVLFLLTWGGLRLRRFPLRDLLGWRRGRHAFLEDLGAAAVFWITAVIILAAIAVVLRFFHLSPAQKTIAALAPRTPLESVLWITLSLCAGFCEELVFRGYFLRQFASAGAGLWLGVLASSLLFGISHGYEGAAGMIAITAYGVLFCVLAIARNSLRPGMIAHAWHDIFTGVMLVALHHFHAL